MSLIELVNQLEAIAKVIRTPSGDGYMVWHEWGSGDPLVLLHGGSGAWNHWLQNIETLSQHYRLIVADMPGLGDSDDPPFQFDFRDYPSSVPKLAEVMSLGIETILGNAPFHLCGFSFGSIAGSYVAAAAGARLNSFTLVGSSAFGWAWGGLEKPFLSMHRDMTEDECVAVQQANLANAMLTSKVDEDLARIQLHNVKRARLRSHLITETNVLLPGLRAVTAPLNGIWGREDIYAQPNLALIEGLLRELDPEAGFEVIDGAGHWVMFDAPKEFNSRLLKVLEPRR